jgi:DNA sulfur modification protein DndB
METLYLPALRAKMGDWIYYVTFMKMKFIAERVKAAEEIHKSKALKELIQRELNESKHAVQIKKYLLTDKQRFFNSLVIGVYQGAPEWYELDVKKSDKLNVDELPSYLDGAFGILTLRGDEKLFAIDGQHRAVGIREAKRSLGVDEVSTIFVSHKEDPTGRERTRRLFTRLNRFAKPVRKEEIIALDEDDLIAILTRRFVEDNPVFQEKVSIKKTKAISTSDKKSFTTISTLYDCLDAFLKVGQDSWTDFKRVRPSEHEIEKSYAAANLLWLSLAKRFPVIDEMFKSKPADCAAGRFRHNQGGHLLFRPIGLQLVIETVARFMTRGVSLKRVMLQLSNVPMELASEPWVGLLWDKTNQRMISQPENRKVASKLLYHAAGGSLADLNTNLDAVKKELAGILNRDISQVKLPLYVKSLKLTSAVSPNAEETN